MRTVLFLLPLLATVSQAAAAQEADPVVGRMLALYDEVCLGAFPDDAAVDVLMEQMGAQPLTRAQVRVTFNDDPGRGWVLEDGDRNIQIMLELPPFHACSVRRSTSDGLGDPAAYHALVDQFTAIRPGFREAEPIDDEQDGFGIRAAILQRDGADGSTETLMVFEQRALSEERASRLGLLVDLRFVHQLVVPENRGRKSR